MKSSYPYHGSEIAIIGMAAKFPGSDSVEEFWQNLCLHREGIRFFSEKELAEAGVPEHLLSDPNYVKAKGVLHDSNSFDAEFFSYSDREAVLMDPQLRLYHECAWHALEDAGYAGQKNRDELIGIFGGASANALWTAQHSAVAQQGGAEAYEVINLISRDFFNSRLSYKLNLKGPAVTVQTACSTALVAVHQACQSLLSGDSDVALAGAVSLSLNPALKSPEEQGYLFQEGMILSADGHCKPFDETAQGTVLGDGVGFVVLKRLQDAIDNEDQIYAVLKGSAINNDGNEKIGFTAPSVNGQSDVIEAALALADIDADTVGYIEAHGTGTNLGDPIEVQALLKSYQGFENSPCFLGSVKSNVGHLDTAAGMAGLIKSVMSVKHGLIPATLHFKQLNSKCDLNNSQLSIAAENQQWVSDKPLRAGVSSFGIGGTNAHVIIEEYQEESFESRNDLAPDEECSKWYVLPISAKTETSLQAYHQQLQLWLPTAKRMADVAYTLSDRREHFEVRQALIVDDKGKELFASVRGKRKAHANVYWMFSGQGTQYLNMGRGLYTSEAVYRQALNECFNIIESQAGPDIRKFLIEDASGELLEQELALTENTQLCLFALEFSLARLLSSWGLEAKGYIGHSLGEYVAACLAGVFSLEDALKLVIARGRLMSTTADGAMVAVHADSKSVDLTAWPSLSIAALNTETSFVVSGSSVDIADFKTNLSQKAVEYTALRTSNAFHSSLMDPIENEYRAVLDSVKLNVPKIPIVSNLSGDWVRPERMASSDYWLAHLRQAVQFHQGLGKILIDENAVLVEIGPGKTLSSFMRQHPGRQEQQIVVNALRTAKETEADAIGPRRVLAELYAQNCAIDWKASNKGKANLCSLPGYAFEKKYYLPNFKGFGVDSNAVSAEGYYEEHWRRGDLSEFNSDSSKENSARSVILVMRNGDDAEQALLDALVARDADVIELLPGDGFERIAQGKYRLRPEVIEDYQLLGQELTRAAVSPTKIIQLWHVSSEAHRYRSFAGMMLIVQAFSQLNFNDPMSIYALSEGAYRVSGDESINANAALAYGPIRVIGQEFAHIQCHLIDVRPGALERQTEMLASALFSSNLPLVSALRGEFLWSREFKAQGESWQGKAVRGGIKENAVYLITGGFGGIGAELALHLAREYKAKLVLCSRRDQSDNPLLSQIELAGGEVVTAQIELRDDEAVKQLLDIAVSSFGSINGVFHCAGIPGETMIMRHQLSKAAAVIDTKITPAEKLLSLAPEYSLDLVVFFSSVTGILGGVGQSDYCAANAGLDALAEQARAQGLSQFYSIRWDAWRETGMAVDALNGKLEVLKRSGHEFLGDLIRSSDSEAVFRQELSVSTCWALKEHLVMGLATVPGSTYIEIVSAAFRQLSGEQSLKVSEVYFLAPLSLDENQYSDMYTQLKREGNGYSFEIGSYQRESQQWHLHARGHVAANNDVAGKIESPCVELEALKKQYQNRYLDQIDGAAHLGVLAMGVELSTSEQDSMMKYGERWSVVKEIWLGFQKSLARLELAQEFHSDLETMSLHPSLLDCALSYLRAFLDGGVYIPISYQRLTQYQPLTSEFYSHVQLSSLLNADLGVMNFNVQLLSPKGELLVDISEFTMRRIGQDFASANASARSLSIPDYVRQYRALTKGLTTQDAIAAMEVIVQSSSSLSLLAASDFAYRYANADDGDMGLFDEEHHLVVEVRARPELSVEFVAAKSKEQKQVAEVWQQMLGIERVGIQDDFFELGGDSLLLMQIHKKIQTLFECEIAVVELYNNPTIRQLVDFLSSKNSDAPDLVLADVSDRIEKKKAAAARRRKKR